MARNAFAATTNVLTNMVLMCLAAVLIAMLVYLSVNLGSQEDATTPKARARIGLEHARDVAENCAPAGSDARRVLKDGKVTDREMGELDRRLEIVRATDASKCRVKPKHLDRTGAMDIPEF